MITSPNEYYSKLFLIQDYNRLQNSIGNLPPIPIPENKPCLKVDLDTRKIEAPEFLSLRKDQKAETIFFEVDRFYDNVDLAFTTCVIQYITPDGDERVYPVPFYDTVTDKFKIVELTNEKYIPNKYYIYNHDNGFVLSKDAFNSEQVYYEIGEGNKMYIPWQVGNEATKEAGTLTFNLRFFIIDIDNKEFAFNLSTLSAKSKILDTLEVEINEETGIYNFNELDELLDRVKRLEGKYNLYWIEID